jgi:hypothetical protein
VKRAGVPGVGFHQLRHFYASLLIRHDESVKTVQLRFGHASAVETLNTYSHLWPDSDDRTREAVELVLGTSAEGPQSAAPTTLPRPTTRTTRPAATSTTTAATSTTTSTTPISF